MSSEDSAVTKVFVVTAGQWDSFCWEAVFTTRELAEQYVAGACKRRARYDHINNRVEEWTVHSSLIPDQASDLGEIAPQYADLYTLPGQNEEASSTRGCSIGGSTACDRRAAGPAPDRS
jgi:hypothetical protein